MLLVTSQGFSLNLLFVGSVEWTVVDLVCGHGKIKTCYNAAISRCRGCYLNYALSNDEDNSCFSFSSSHVYISLSNETLHGLLRC